MPSSLWLADLHTAIYISHINDRIEKKNAWWGIRVTLVRASVTEAKKMLTENVWCSDPELFALMRKEHDRQRESLELIASENFTSLSVLQCLSSSLHNKYSEGLPGQRYYGGNEWIDEIERLAQQRALQAFGLKSEVWGCNVQPYSGSPANLAIYTGLLEPGEQGKLMGLHLPEGGHLTHGFQTAQKKISASAIFFHSRPYHVNTDTGLIDYDRLERDALDFEPKLIIAGVSCYSRTLDYGRFREICDKINGCLLMSDISHVAGLMAAGLIDDAFAHSDVVMTTTHKTMRGPRAAIIFYRRELAKRIDQAVFPGLQGGPHNNAIAAMATALLQVQTDEFKTYQRNVLANARALCVALQKYGYAVVTGGTDVHMMLIDLRNKGLSGGKGEAVLEAIGVACNKNTVPGDKSALNPSGIRLGTPALTTRGMTTSDMEVVAKFIDAGIQLGRNITKRCESAKLKEFCERLTTDEDVQQQVAHLKAEVKYFATKFALPGNGMMY